MRVAWSLFDRRGDQARGLPVGGAPELLEAVRAHEEYVTGETLATSLSYDGAGAGEAATIEGLALTIAVERV